MEISHYKSLELFLSKKATLMSGNYQGPALDNLLKKQDHQIERNRLIAHADAFSRTEGRKATL